MNSPSLSDKELREKLTTEQYHVLREKGTEMPFSGEYVHTKEKGSYQCAACGVTLFSSDAKFDSGTGWPSFMEPANREHVILKEDQTHGMNRTEVLCKNCGSHLGHVFNDGPGPTCERFCINSAALTLKKENN